MEKTKKLHHTYYFQCPLCSKMLIGCHKIECERCDRWDDGDNHCIALPETHVGDISCQCNQQQVIATLICQNIELETELDETIAKLNKFTEFFRVRRKDAKDLG
jgi:hypothetical protein